MDDKEKKIQEKEYKKKVKRSRFNYVPVRTKKDFTRDTKKFDPKCQEATPEILRIEIDHIFKEFLNNPDELEYIFPTDLNNLQRKYIHSKAQAMNLASKSYGKEPNRQLHIKKRNKLLANQSYFISPGVETESIINESIDVQFLNKNKPLNLPDLKFKRSESFRGGRFINSVPCIPSEAHCPKDLVQIRKSLPIWEHRGYLVQTIRNNQITIISSETGSGKTTQVPQYILEDARVHEEPCKVICTQPRRISTVSSAERVSSERGDNLGSSVGYHIKLEQNYGLNTSLIYCTTGVLVRNLMACGNELLNITHIILDEVHERDKLIDFLLICLKQYLQKYPALKVILMSATVDAQKFRDYFGTGECILIPGRLFAIDLMCLENILLVTKYKSSKMLKAELDAEKETGDELQIGVFGEDSPDTSLEVEDYSYMDEALDEYLNFSENYDYRIHYEEATAQLGMYFLSEDISVNYKHSNTGRTALMIAAHLGDKEFISRLCNMGANMELCDQLGKTVFDYAKDNPDILHLLEFIKSRRENKPKIDNCNAEAERLLRLYDKTTLDDFIDFDLIVTVIKFIHNSKEEGSILVFLPGYDDIMMCNDRILSSVLDYNTYRIFFLHGSMNIRDQHDVFKKIPGKRKIILSTNIAETSITIDDVVFVIDSGKAKEKCYDSYNKVSSLQTRWISKACAKQRMGRAGRTKPGICFRLYSQQRFENMEAERIPEILRVSLEELCLHSKILAPDGMNIHDFLMMAPDTPSANSIKVAIENLQYLGALDQEEDLTRLGEYLAQLTVEPHLGKILIFGVIFRCLEPILTLVSAMTHKDPFQLPPQANLKSQAAERRKELLDGVMSDHLLYLEVFRKWQEASCVGKAHQFCEQYFISHATMNSILETRSQQLAQLRSLNFVYQSNAIDSYNFNANSWPLVKAVLCTGMYPNMAFPRGSFLATRCEKKVNIHNSSACGNRPITTWLIYDEMIKQRTNLVIRGVTAITPLTIALMAGINILYPNTNSINIDEWLEFEMPNDHSCQMRRALEQIVTNVISYPNHHYSKRDVRLLDGLKRALDAEEKYADLTLPHYIGIKPKFFFPQNDMVTYKNRNQPKMYSNGASNGIQKNYQSYPNNSPPKSRGAFSRTPRKPIKKAVHPVSYGGNHSKAPVDHTLYNSMNSLDLSSNNSPNLMPSHADRLFNGIASSTTGYNSKAFNKYENCSDQKRFMASSNGLTNQITSTDRLVSSIATNENRYHSHKYANCYDQKRFGLSSNDSVSHDINPSERLLNGITSNGSSPADRLLNSIASNTEGYSLKADILNKYGNYCDEKIFILIKPKQLKNISIAFMSNKWIFAPQTEKKILHFVEQHKPVYLVFTVFQSRALQGIAQFLNLHNDTAGKPTASIEWIFKAQLPYASISHLKNSYNHNKPLFEGLDGQVIKQDIAEELFRIYESMGEAQNLRSIRPILSPRPSTSYSRYSHNLLNDQNSYDHQNF